MKKTISALLSVCILLSMICSFHVPAEATSVYNIDTPHTEIIFGGSSQATLPFVFTVQQSGYYIFQTMGYESSDGEIPPAKGEVYNMLVRDSDYIPAGYCDNGNCTGYDINLLMSCELEAGEQYTLTMDFSDNTSFCRLMITYAEEHYINNAFPIQNYVDIVFKNASSAQDTFSLNLTFTRQNISKAQICRLIYYYAEEAGHVGEYDVEVDCPYEVNVLLLDPRSLSPLYYGDSPMRFDLSDGAPVFLEYEVPYFLVVYFDWIDAENILDTPVTVKITFR